MTATTHAPARPLVLASAGVGMIGVSFGMARYGFGLLAPDIRVSFGLGSGALGLLAAASYLAYLATSVVAGALTESAGPRAVVTVGGGCAVAGMVVAGIAQSAPVLFAGLLVAGASAGLVFPPFSDVVARALAPGAQSRVLSAISSGTGWGVAVAAPVALLAGSNWRAAWLVFAALAAIATAWALVVLPGAPVAQERSRVKLSLRWFLCPRSRPLLIGAGLVGIASSVYWTFAVDHLVSDGGLAQAQSRLFLAVVGVASIGGTISGDAVRRLGGRVTFCLGVGAEAAALVLLGLAPGHLGVALGSAVLFGMAYNVAVAVQVIWSGLVFAERPAAGLAAVLVMNALGLLVGPPALGLVADHTGFAVVFCAAGALITGTVLLAPREPLLQ